MGCTKVLELFAGTRSIGKAFEAKGHEVYSVEWNKDFDNINLYADIMTVTAEQIIKEFGRPDIIWASPDCTTYSVAAISKHREKEPNGNLRPKTEYATFCDMVNNHVVNLIKELNPKYWFIKNFTSENDIVLDPFMGCGTTAVSCIEQNRHYIGYELCEEYIKVANERISG